MSDSPGELFEVELLGGTTERRYRKLRPEVEAIPWGTLDLRSRGEDELLAARAAWTAAAYEEHRTAVGCTQVLRALLEARAPLDLVAVASRFLLDEAVHVELCARMAAECGGGTEIRYDPQRLARGADPSFRPLVQACELALRFFCVGEALSVPLLRATWRRTTHPLPRAVFGRIVKDEAAHGMFGFTVLDWALPELTPAERHHLAREADAAIDVIEREWSAAEREPQRGWHDGALLVWLDTEPYLAIARAALTKKVREPLLGRGLPLRSRTQV